MVEVTMDAIQEDLQQATCIRVDMCKGVSAPNIQMELLEPQAAAQLIMTPDDEICLELTGDSPEPWQERTNIGYVQAILMATRDGEIICWMREFDHEFRRFILEAQDNNKD